MSARGMKRLHKHLSYFCQPLLTCQRGNGLRKDGADSLGSAGSDKKSRGLGVMFGFLTTNMGFIL